MATSSVAQITDFTRDVIGRFFCNCLDEVLRSANPQARRSDGLPSTPTAPSFIRLQTHTGRIAFRNIRIKAL